MIETESKEIKSKNLNFIPRKLNAKNIDKALLDYLDALKTIPLSIGSDNVLSFLSKMKRDKINAGPYPNVSMFEAGNRIMTDLTILYGVRDLLNGKIPEIDFAEYIVEFGNENKNKHDITAAAKGSTLIGEAFNVSQSYFHTKKSSALRKMKKTEQKDQILVLLYNDDARKNHGHPKISDNEFHYSVKIDFSL